MVSEQAKAESDTMVEEMAAHMAAKAMSATIAGGATEEEANTTSKLVASKVK